MIPVEEVNKDGVSDVGTDVWELHWTMSYLEKQLAQTLYDQKAQNLYVLYNIVQLSSHCVQDLLMRSST